MHVQHIFNFRRIDVFTAGDNHVLFAVHDVDIAFAVHHRQIPGAQPAVGKGLAGFVRQVPVAGGDGVAAHPDFAHLFFIGGHGRCIFIHHLEVDADKRPPGLGFVRELLFGWQILQMVF